MPEIVGRLQYDFVDFGANNFLLARQSEDRIVRRGRLMRTRSPSMNGFIVVENKCQTNMRLRCKGKYR